MHEIQKEYDSSMQAEKQGKQRDCASVYAFDVCFFTVLQVNNISRIEYPCSLRAMRCSARVRAAAA